MKTEEDRAEIIKERVNKWLEYAYKDDYESIFIDTMENFYQEKPIIKKYKKRNNI